jgi:transcriptional regulator with XRE-family HTH domain
MKKVTPIPKRAPYRLTFMRQWREQRGKSLEQVAEGVGTTHATLSRIERGLIPYSQDMLEKVATYLNTDPASLIMRDPTDQNAIWTIWEHAEKGERQMIIDLAQAVIKRRTGS